MTTVFVPVCQVTESPLSIAVPFAVMVAVAPVDAVADTAFVALLVVAVYSVTAELKDGERDSEPMVRAVRVGVGYTGS